MNKRFIATALTGLVAVGLAACSPPNQQDSEVKVETAQGQSADSITEGSTWTTGEASAKSSSKSANAATTAAAGAGEVSFVDCVAAPAQEPAQVTLDCANPADAIVNIQWTGWGEDEAEGNGLNQTTGAPAVVTLSEATETPDGDVYTVIEVDGVPVTQ